MSTTKKKFDCVEFMRMARDEISKAIEGMSPEEEIAWLRSQPISDPRLRKMLEEAYAKQDKEDQQKKQNDAGSPPKP